MKVTIEGLSGGDVDVRFADNVISFERPEDYFAISLNDFWLLVKIAGHFRGVALDSPR
jgi:hypothetical protein